MRRARSLRTFCAAPRSYDVAVEIAKAAAAGMANAVAAAAANTAVDVAVVAAGSTVVAAARSAIVVPAIFRRACRHASAIVTTPWYPTSTSLVGLP